MDNYWIIGGGQFGLRAARALEKIDRSNRIRVVEKQEDVCRQLDRMGIETVCMDGLQYLAHELTRGHDPDWIIPAIPLHVAYEWIRARMSDTCTFADIAFPDELLCILPNPIMAGTGQLYISIADFECPGNCVEPEEICTHNGKPRSMVLHEFLKSIQQKDFITVVIQSHQLGPGVGGYRPADLYRALEQIQTEDDALLLATACSCHGVVNTFKLSARSE